jgi:hypothetical protein
LDEERDGRRVRGDLRRRPPASIWQRQRQDRVLVLAAQPKRLPTRDQHRELRAGREEVGDHGRGRQDLLEVVEQQQDRSRPQVLLDGVHDRAVIDVPHAEDLRDGRRHERRVRDRGQLDQEHPMLEVVQEVGGDLEAQARLPRPARPRERHEPRAVLEQPADLGQLAFPPQQRGRVGGEIVGASVEGRERREVRCQVRDDDLEDALRLGQVLEAVLPEVPQADAIR